MSREISTIWGNPSGIGTTNQWQYFPVIDFLAKTEMEACS